ncbi:uncharacterized protein LOC143303418 [Bombus vancouverensis nearcticus]|uniref:uncharacterized protein LOC143303418 n=1 Tax=Bombus vancouverensis nearcticus TaxID=2705178 RepID=UPI00402B1287
MKIGRESLLPTRLVDNFVYGKTPVSGLTWTKFTEHFLLRYGGTETATSVLIRMLNEPPLKDETTGAFGNCLHSLLSAKWENLTSIEIINAAVLLRLILHDQLVESIALTEDIRTRDQFLKEMRVLSHARKRPIPSSNNPSAEPEVKRRNLSAHQPRCLYCGNDGHKIKECRSRMRSEQRKNTQRQEGSRPATSSQVVCFKCHAEGHIAPDCPLRQNRKPGP